MKKPYFVTLVILILLGQQKVAFANDVKDLGKKVAGTYLEVDNNGAQIMQIHEDGTLAIIISIQFSGGVLGKAFSETFGSWKKTGKQELTATTVDLTFQKEDGEFFGVAPATYVLKFDEKFLTANVSCEGAIFPVGVNPFDSEAQPIPGSEFTCDDLTEFRRISPESSFQLPAMINEPP